MADNSETIVLRATVIAGKRYNDYTVIWREHVDWPDHASYHSRAGLDLPGGLFSWIGGHGTEP